MSGFCTVLLDHCLRGSILHVLWRLKRDETNVIKRHHFHQVSQDIYFSVYKSRKRSMLSSGFSICPAGSSLSCKSTQSLSVDFWCHRCSRKVNLVSIFPDLQLCIEDSLHSISLVFIGSPNTPRYKANRSNRSITIR